MWTNPKTHVVYVKEESFVKSLVVREEVSKRPSKKARIEAPTEPRSEAFPEARPGAISEARSEDSIHMSGVDKVYIEIYFKDLADAMRDEFGTCLKEIKLLGNSIEVVEKKLGITGKKTSSDDLLLTTSSLPKWGLEHRVKVALEKTLEKAKEAKEAKAKEAKTKEAKEFKAKESKEAKEAKAKEAKLAEEAEEAKLAEEAEEAKATKTSLCDDTVLCTAPEAETKRLSKRDSALVVVRARSERDRKLAASQQSPFQGNNTAKVIIPNTKVGHGYDPFALPDKSWRKSLERKPNGCLSYWYQKVLCEVVSLEDFPVSLLVRRLRRRLTVRFLERRTYKYSLEQFTYERVTVGVRQCRAGDCGVNALKYIECHALGMTSFHAAFCDKNVKLIREKMTHDIYHETHGFGGIKDKSSYYKDLDTYG
ncbi:hypothetical protein N665_0355s0020 [Sinapis alba]|nr:hypothetical protein N665_0355s0020 [Sinapis alba]